jgi:ribosome maturation factor RimP
VATDQTRERLVSELTPHLLDMGLDLEAVEVTPAGRRRILRIAVDKDGGVTMDDVAEATKEVSRVLDASDTMGEQPYTLEVTSPGVDRPLTLPRHWRRNGGRLVKVATRDGRTTVGRIVMAGEEHATLDVEGAQQTVGFDDVATARIQIEFNRPRGTAEPGSTGDEEG